MHKLVVFNKLPRDPLHLREHYESVHVPLPSKMPAIVVDAE
ncbi:hypothetical protein [Sphingomonas sp. MMS24-J13]